MPATKVPNPRGLVTQLVRCEGRAHPGKNGHDHGPARFVVAIACPACTYTQTVRLCAGRVEFVSRTHRMECPQCHRVDEPSKFWRAVLPIDSEPVAAEPEVVPDPPRLDAGELLARWDTSLAAGGRAPATRKRRVRAVERLTSEHTDLLSVTTSDLEAALAAKAATVKAEALKSELEAYRGFYGWAVREGLLIANPAAGLSPIRVPVAEGRTVTDEQVRKALATASAPLRAMLLLGRYGGLRLSEIASLRVRDREGDTLRVLGKGGRRRRVPLNRDLLHALLELERAGAEEFYFPGRFTGHIHPQSLNKLIVRHLGANPHALRHAAATAAYRKTRNLQAVQVFLGHSSVATTQRYLHLDPSDLRAAADATVMPDDDPQGAA